MGQNDEDNQHKEQDAKPERNVEQSQEKDSGEEEEWSPSKDLKRLAEMADDTTPKERGEEIEKERKVEDAETDDGSDKQVKKSLPAEPQARDEAALPPRQGKNAKTLRYYLEDSEEDMDVSDLDAENDENIKEEAKSQNSKKKDKDDKDDCKGTEKHGKGVGKRTFLAR